MQTIGQRVMNEYSMELNVEWTFTNNYSDEAALKLFEERMTLVEKLDVVTLKEISELQSTLNSLFLIKTENYWYGQIRLNTLASRLPKQPKQEVTQSTYPITLNEFDNIAFDIDSNQQYFQYGKAAREWMKYWLFKNGYTSFTSEATVKTALSLVTSAYAEFWLAFQTVTTQQQWQQLMKDQLGFEFEDEEILNAFYSIYTGRIRWSSLTSYQTAFMNATIPWHQLNSIPIAQHPFTKQVLRKHGIEIKLSV